MRRALETLLAAIMLSLLLTTDLAWGSVGGPSSLEVLGWDPVDRRVYVLEWLEDDSGDLPLLGYYLVDSDDPDRVIPVRGWARGEEWHARQVRFWARLDELRARLEPLEPVEPVGLELSERLLGVGPCPGLAHPELQASCRDLEVQLRWRGQERELRLLSWGSSDLVGAWAVPGGEHHLVVYTHLGHTYGQGYQQELSLLFGSPPKDHAGIAAGERPSGERGGQDRAAMREASGIRHY